jgi:hypothetical protein
MQGSDSDRAVLGPVRQELDRSEHLAIAVREKAVVRPGEAREARYLTSVQGSR